MKAVYSTLSISMCVQPRDCKPYINLLFCAQVAGQAVPLTKEVTHGIVRPGGKEVSRIADKYSDDASRDKVQVR